MHSVEAQEYVDRIARQRGGVLEFHRVMAKHDFPVLAATDSLTKATVLEDRQLDRRTKQLIFLVALAALNGDPDDLANHIRLALKMEIPAQEILEALEILLPLGGVITFKKAFTLWCEVTKAEGLDPSG
jgi:4-carboxymuconolactone decarboxylase